MMEAMAMGSVKQIPSDGPSQGNSKQHEQWLEGKSKMLDEVSQLVDMMSSEKAELTDQLNKLNVELEGAKGQIEALGAEKTKLEDEQNKRKLKLKELKEKHKQETVDIKDVLERTKQELESTQTEMNMLSVKVDRKQDENRKLSESNQGLEFKLGSLEAKQMEMKSVVQKRSSENSILTSQLTNLREKYKVLYADKSELENTLTTFQDRCKQSQDEILALRGRLTSTRRSHEHLEMKCSTLEDIVQKLNSRSPTVVKVTTRSREEVRLSEECKRKDDLLASSLKEVSTSRLKSEVLQRKVNQLLSKLNEEEKRRVSLQTALESKERDRQADCEEFETRMKLVASRQQEKERQECGFDSLKSNMEEKLKHIDHELKTAREELLTLRKEVTEKEERSNTEMSELRQKREEIGEHLKLSEEETKRLKHELEEAQQTYHISLDSMSREWRQQLSEASEDYRRMKEASTKRCTELAKENLGTRWSKSNRFLPNPNGALSSRVPSAAIAAANRKVRMSMKRQKKD